MTAEAAIVWELISALTVEDLKPQQADLRQRLRRLTMDPDLKLLGLEAWEEEKTVIFVEGKPDGFRRVRTLLKTMQLSEVLGILVRDVRLAEGRSPQSLGQVAEVKGKEKRIPKATPKANLQEEQGDKQELNELEEKKIYSHLIECVQKETTAEVLDRFRHLFVEALYQNQEIQGTLEHIVMAKQADRTFPLFLNHCCYLIIDYWQLNPENHEAIPQLVAILTEVPPSLPGFRQSRAVKRLRELMLEFPKTPQFRYLDRLSHVIYRQRPSTQNTQTQILGTLLYRYPFLYKYCLLNEESRYEHTAAIRRVQERTLQYRSFRLARFVTYQVRLAEVARARQLSSTAGRLLRRETNPTLLNERDLAIALKLFCGKIQGGYSYAEIAQRFRQHLTEIPSYKAFKDDLLAYLLTTLESDYIKNQFKRKIQEELQQTLPRYDSQKLTEPLLMRTATKLLNFLVVESEQHPEHYQFIELIANIGAPQTVILLLKLVLLCPPVLPELDKRLALLFERYESFERNHVLWLIQILENFQVAYSLHFGNVDLSMLKKLIR